MHYIRYKNIKSIAKDYIKMRLTDQKPWVSHPLLGFLEDFVSAAESHIPKVFPGQQGCKTPGVLASP